MLSRARYGTRQPGDRAWQYLACTLVVFSFGSTSTRAADGAKPLVDAVTADEQRIMGRLDGATAETLQFITTTGASVPMGRIRRMVLPRHPRALPDGSWKRIQLRNGDVLHAELASSVASAEGKRQTSLSWLPEFKASPDLPLSGVASLSHPIGLHCLVYHDFERDGTDWKDADGREIPHSAEHAKSGKQSLKSGAQNPVMRYQLGESLADCWMAFHFFVDPDAITAGECQAVAKFGQGDASVNLPIRLMSSHPWHSVDVPKVGEWTQQNVPRRAGWHVVNLSFSGDQILVTLDGFQLAMGKLDADAALHFTGIEINSSLMARSVWIDDLTVIRPRKLATSTAQTATDQLDLVSGDQLFGTLRRLDTQHVQFTARGVETRFSWADVSQLGFAEHSTTALPVSGLLVQIDLQPWGHMPELNHADSLRGALLNAGLESCEVEHPVCGRLSIPWRQIYGLQPMYHGQEWILEGQTRHLGDQVKSGFTRPVPEGKRLDWSFDLAAIPPGMAFVSLAMSELEPAGTGTLPHAWLDRLRAGQLTSELWVNSRRIAVLNQGLTGRGSADRPQQLRIELPNQSLIVGKNQVSIRLQPGPTATVEYDNWELRSLRLEVESSRKN